MKNFEMLVGFPGSEVERAALVANTLPTETWLETAVKRELALIFNRIAKSADQVVSARQAAQH